MNWRTRFYIVETSPSQNSNNKFITISNHIKYHKLFATIKQNYLNIVL